MGICVRAKALVVKVKARVRARKVLTSSVEVQAKIKIKKEKAKIYIDIIFSIFMTKIHNTKQNQYSSNSRLCKFLIVLSISSSDLMISSS